MSTFVHCSECGYRVCIPAKVEPGKQAKAHCRRCGRKTIHVAEREPDSKGAGND